MLLGQLGDPEADSIFSVASNHFLAYLPDGRGGLSSAAKTCVNL